MDVIVKDTLIRLENYFSQANFNATLKFTTINVSSLGQWANLTSGNSECLFNIAFQRFKDLEQFIKTIGERCSQIRDCIIITHIVQDMNLVERYWRIADELSSDENALPDFNDECYNHD
jgi:hypothetical protein